jgi:hypothetical protein
MCHRRLLGYEGSKGLASPEHALLLLHLFLLDGSVQGALQSRRV